jgi:hypothetical protein
LYCWIIWDGAKLHIWTSQNYQGRGQLLSPQLRHCVQVYNRVLDSFRSSRERCNACSCYWRGTRLALSALLCTSVFGCFALTKYVARIQSDRTALYVAVSIRRTNVRTWTCVTAVPIHVAFYVHEHLNFYGRNDARPCMDAMSLGA